MNLPEAEYSDPLASGKAFVFILYFKMLRQRDSSKDLHWLGCVGGPRPASRWKQIQTCLSSNVLCFSSAVRVHHGSIQSRRLAARLAVETLDVKAVLRVFGLKTSAEMSPHITAGTLNVPVLAEQR